jgi:hypothetical protein
MQIKQALGCLHSDGRQLTMHAHVCPRTEHGECWHEEHVAKIGECIDLTVFEENAKQISWQEYSNEVLSALGAPSTRVRIEQAGKLQVTQRSFMNGRSISRLSAVA